MHRCSANVDEMLRLRVFAIICPRALVLPSRCVYMSVSTLAGRQGRYA
jgi:hypothetical protein